MFCPFTKPFFPQCKRNIDLYSWNILENIHGISLELGYIVYGVSTEVMLLKKEKATIVLQSQDTILGYSTHRKRNNNGNEVLWALVAVGLQIISNCPFNLSCYLLFKNTGCWNYSSSSSWTFPNNFIATWWITPRLKRNSFNDYLRFIIRTQLNSIHQIILLFHIQLRSFSRIL